MKKVISTSAEHTKNEGKDFAKKLKAGDVIFLKGEIGSGKTTFVQGLAIGLGITSRVISPTFVVVRQHEIKSQKTGVRRQESEDRSQIKTLYHLDLYRLGNKDDIKGIDLKDILDDQDGVVLIEWPAVGKDLIDRKTWSVTFSYIDSEKREIQYEYGIKG